MHPRHKTRFILIASLLLLSLVLAACGGKEEPTPEATAIPTEEPQAEPTDTPQETAVVATEATEAPQPTAEPAPTDEPAPTPEPEPTPFVPVASSLASGRYIYSNVNELRNMTVYDNKIWGAGTGGVVSYDLTSGEARKYTTLDGLPHGASFGIDVCPIPEAALVVGTYNGLAIYDPDSDSFIDGDSIYQTDTRVLDLKCNETLLVAYDDNGVNVYDSETGIIDFYDDDNLAWVSVESITIDGDNIWMSSSFKGVTLLNNGEATIYSLENGNFPSDDIDSIAVAPNGDLWVGASEGLFIITPGGDITEWNKDNSPDISYFGPSRVAFAPDGSLWAAFGSTLCQWDAVNGRCLTQFGNEEGKASGSISNFIVAADGSIYLQTFDAGMSSYDGSAWTPYYLEGEYPTNFVYDITQDVDGNIWTINGALNRTDLEASFWETNRDVFGEDIIPDPNGGVWIAGGRSLFYADENGSTRYAPEEGLLDAFARTVEMDSQGRIWVGQDNGISIFDGSEFTLLDEAAGWPEGQVNDLLADGNVIWAAASGQLVKINADDLTWEIIFNEENNGGLNQTYFGDMELYDDGMLVEASGGLYFFDGSSLSQFQGADCNVGQVQVDYENNVWLNCFGDIFGTVGSNLSKTGVYVWLAADGEWMSITPADGLPSASVRGILIDNAGTVWLVGGDSANGGGILRIVP
jgi:ligand-binding sensor domain-containing protein